MRILAGCALLLAVTLAPASARANDDTELLGWSLVAGSVVIGTSASLLGLNIDCPPGDVDCQRESSVLIWGGVGFASLGSLIGITIVQHGERGTAGVVRQPARKTPSYRLTLEPMLLARPSFSESAQRSGLLLRLTLP